ncbi:MULTISPECIES: polysaccharide deacetylase family protein [Alteromonadaceae]|uniref:polysaccharide deacetylase family protein n=1 Tax=Alteromonadaceae TaxID=72275 RepID=UPI001C0963C6|nr:MULTISPECIES: polysaccharide deacetylase family protein [Aliiglaciecola]MBU2879056.1 polysaccharide deacetylase family protein [Aliiglaciecola lipolytica]MDO6710754.1 polysaccharide deacetylase family protein [Aliiglaciecola sp. 2_MG-2023]MDO6751838.1 polysaccharide deacetylase family protein [Aliiglaciecola sp. 1_MG-2023]
MSLDDSYLQYPKRHYGMDHDLYDWSMLTERKPIVWPNNKKLALWVNINVQFFPLNQGANPVAVPGGMKMPYPDLRHFSLRDYGNRVGIFRIFKALDKFNIKPTIAINGAMVERAPYLMDVIKERGNEVIAHGWQMDMLHHGEVSPNDEASWVAKSVQTLRERFEQPVKGWLSPGRLQSENTPELLQQNGIDYMCDWVNDELPYAFRTETGQLSNMPLSNELDDFFILQNNLHSEDSYVEQIQDACDLLLSEAETQGGRLLALNIHPWMLGQPHRIACFEKVLEYISSKDGVWSASASDIYQSWQAQQ